MIHQKDMCPIAFGNVAMENPTFIDDVPIKHLHLYMGISQLVMFDDQRILPKSAFWWMPGSPQQQSLSWSGLGSGLQVFFSMDSLFFYQEDC